VLVLCYHAVSDDWDDPLAVPVRDFERQVRWLQARGRRLHVTFDDAYTSARAGLAVLERLGVPATVVVCTDFAEDGAPLEIPELTGEPVAELATLSWAELRELADRGVGVGSHTRSHAHLTRLDDAGLARELHGSRARIEAELDRPCTQLAYPFGEEDQRVRAAARAAGYECAFALPGRSRPRDPFALPRVGVYRRDTPLRLTAKAALVHGPVGRLRREAVRA
jgi:peptidoglycan/xylan/chitin deacetylase (PgdA/CDA1 family)